MDTDIAQLKPRPVWLTTLEHIPMFVSAIALFSLMLLTFADVVLRSTFNAPIQAATEITRILVAVVVFSALPVVSANGTHIAVDLLDSFFNPAMARIRDAIIYGVCGLMLYWPLIRIVKLAERARDYGDVTEYLSIPMFWVAYGIAFSIAVTAVALIARAVVVIFNKSLTGTA